MSSYSQSEIDGYSEAHVVENNIDAAPVWNNPGNGVASAEMVIGGSDLWPSLSEGVNTRIKTSYRTVPETPLSLTSNDSSSRKNVRHGGRNNRQPRNNAARLNVGNAERSHQHRQSSGSQVTDVSVNHGSNNGNAQPEARHSNGPGVEFHSGGNHPHHQDPNRRGHGAPPRGDGSNGPLLNVGRDVNAHSPNFNGRNGHVQPPPVFPAPVIGPILPIAPYPPISPLPYMAPGFHPFSGGRVLCAPPVGPILMRPHPLFRPVGPPHINHLLCKQIDYYFSDENLVKDVHLRRNMDEQGWVMVTTIAEFNMVGQIIAQAKQFLDDNKIDPLWFILNAVLNSYDVEVQGNRLRKRIDWKKYILPNSIEASSTAAESDGQSSSAAAEIYADGDIATHLNNAAIEANLIRSDSRMEAEDNAADDQAGSNLAN